MTQKLPQSRLSRVLSCCTGRLRSPSRCARQLGKKTQNSTAVLCRVPVAASKLVLPRPRSFGEGFFHILQVRVFALAMV